MKLLTKIQAAALLCAGSCRAFAGNVDHQTISDAAQKTGNRNKASQAAMNVVVNAGIPLRTNGQYKIMHDKVIITNGQNVEAGMFLLMASGGGRGTESPCLVGVRCPMERKRGIRDK